MLQTIKNIITLLASLFFLFSCSDEELMNREVQVEEGIPVTATLSFGASNTVKVETKASDIADNNPVNSLAILVFNTDEKKIGDTQFFSGIQQNETNIEVSTTSGRRLVYAVANYKSSLFDMTNELERIQTLKDLKDLAVTLPSNNISVLDNQFLMSGWFVGNTTDQEGLCIIDADGTIKNSQAAGYVGKIDLKRIMASVKFTVSCGSENAKFVADSWQVKNVPSKSYLIENAGAKESISGGNDDYFSSKLNANFEIDADTYSFSFLMLENRKQPNGTPASYDDREKMDGESPETFSVANENSTYVVIKGTYEGETIVEVDNDGSNKYVKAFTTYYVHLGDWRGGNYSNFNIFRNNRYIYTVKVISVDKLIVEVVTDDGSEEVWGADGDMFLSSNNIRTFDAHYGTTVISFSKQMIRDFISEYYCKTENDFVEKFKIIASTPKSNKTAVEDLDWVTYRRNTAGSSQFMKYKDISTGIGEPLNADGFRRDLYNVCQLGDGNDSIHYTCFIDEYYYKDMQLRDFINQEPRTMQIWTYYKPNTTGSSTSSVSKAAYTFAQRSICTIYDLDKLDNNIDINGWGTEWTQEGEDLSTAINKSGFKATNNDLLQGRNNMITQLGMNTSQLQWDDYVDHTTNNLQENYKYAEYACLNRNRDLNGNGKIDDDEIRWYLPAINQYMGYSMGDNVLPEEVRLFTGNTYDTKFIYTSNTVQQKGTTGSYDTQVFWACEGSSIGYFWDEGTPTKPYRCIRNLRDVTQVVDDFVVPSTETVEEKDIYLMFERPEFEGTYRFKYLDYIYLNPRAIREKVNQALTPNHNNTEEENRLSSGINIGEIQIYYNEDYFQCAKLITLARAVNENPCASLGEGWRLPNQRELTILTSHMPVKSQNPPGQYTFEKISLASCTMAKYFDPNEPNRVYFNYQYTNQIHNMSMAESIGRPYRCVKDR